jgi:hypothetical protein
LVVLYLILFFLPIIPVQSAPVIPNPVYGPAGLSLFQIVARFVAPLVGVTYRWEWYSYLVLVALLAISAAAGVLLLRKR